MSIACIVKQSLHSFVGAVADRSVRLLGGTDDKEGIVEIAYNGRWGMLCDSDLLDVDARPICRGLGYGIDQAQVISSSSPRLSSNRLHHAYYQRYSSMT